MDRQAVQYVSGVMPVLDSEALSFVRYFEDSKILRATFRENGRTYDYFGVPQEAYDALMAAESKGAWFNANIKPRYFYKQV